MMHEGKLPERLKEVRKSMGLSQRKMAEYIGKAISLWQRYENGESSPGSSVIQKLADKGFDANWILTGEGNMLRSANNVVHVEHEYKSNFDEDLLRHIILKVETNLEETDCMIEPEIKAALYVLLYKKYIIELKDKHEGDTAEIIDYVKRMSGHR